MKRNIIISVLLVLTMLSLRACKAQVIDETQKDKPVKAEKLKEEEKLVSINLEDGEDADFSQKELRGIWVKLQYILSDEEDYVYTIEEDRAQKKTVIIKALSGNDALVEGLKEGDLLITSGYSKLSEGQAVKNRNGDE